MEVKLHASLTIALNGGEWSGSHSEHFIPGESVPGTLYRTGRVHPQSGRAEQKIPASARNQTPAIHPIMSLLTKPSLSEIKTS
jgi:hypothetical protein